VTLSRDGGFVLRDLRGARSTRRWSTSVSCWPISRRQPTASTRYEAGAQSVLRQPDTALRAGIARPVRRRCSTCWTRRSWRGSALRASGVGRSDPLRLAEKCEALDLVPALEPGRPDDWFLIVGNDNDFVARHCVMQGQRCDSAFDNDGLVLVNRLTLPRCAPASAARGAPLASGHDRRRPALYNARLPLRVGRPPGRQSMLQNIRDKLQGQRWLAFTVLGALALVFALWGAYGIVDITVGAPTYAAKVNGESIPVEEVNRVWQEQQPEYLRLFGGEIPAARREALQNEVLDAFIRNAAVLQRADDAGFRVSREQVIKAIEREPAFQIEGKYSAEAARARLAQAGVTVAAYEADRRRSLSASQVVGAVSGTDFMTPTEISQLLALENEQRELRYAVLAPQAFASTKAPDAAAIEAYYNEHKADFMTAETVRLAYAELDLATLSAQLQVSDADLQERYEKNKARYVEPERRRARHILIAVNEPKDDAAALKKAQDLQTQLKAGADFAALAKQHSQDTGSAQQGGDLGWADRTVYVKPFADTLFAMQAGELSAPVKTQFGYHIIRLDEIRAGREKSFAEARPELEAELHRDQAADQFGDRQEQLQQRLERPGSDFARLAQEFGMKTAEIESFTRGAGGAPLGSDPELNQTVFGDLVLNQRRVGGPVALGEDRLVIVKVLDHQPPQLKPLAAVRDAIVTELARLNGSEASRKAGEAALAKLRAGESFDKVARELGVTAAPAKYVGRGDPELPVQVRDFAFASAKPAAGKPLYHALPLDQGGTALIELSNVRVAPEDGNNELKQQRVQQELQRHGAAEADAYVDEIVRGAKVQKNLQAFQ
jgi:peptidyl-prolyl cis-trans isomerase D